VPISYWGRAYNEGKKINWKDGVAAVYTIIKYFIIDDCFNEQYGHAILQNLSHARRFNKWLLKLIEPYLGLTIFEIGSGIGNISRQLPQREKLTVSDVNEKYLDILHLAYDNNQLVDVVRFDITQNFDSQGIEKEICDTVVCLNVLEHIEDDFNAVCRIRELLQPGGKMILLLPQHEWLYGSYDRVVGHYRRYTRKGIQELLTRAGFETKHLKNFNFLSIPAWWVNACVFKKKRMSKYQLKFYDLIVPAMRFIERILPLPGLSLICIAEKIPDK
jgi:SAM-dependent methyltransferase